MHEDFDATLRESSKLEDPSWLADMEQKAKERLLAWISEQIKEKLS